MKNTDTNMKNLTTTNNETIGDFVKKHTTNEKSRVCIKNKNSMVSVKNKKSWVYLDIHQDDYLNKEDSELFVKLTLCTVGNTVSASIEKNGNVVVYDNNGMCYASYDYDCPVVDVYKDLITKMTKDVEDCIISLKKRYIELKEFRLEAYDDAGTWNTLVLFGEDYGIEFEEGYDEYKEPYADIININDNKTIINFPKEEYINEEELTIRNIAYDINSRLKKMEIRLLTAMIGITLLLAYILI